MPSISLRSLDGSALRTLDLDESVFGVQPNVPVMHQVVVAQLAAARRGTQSTRTRAEVSGGGAKPFKQKGTGRARQGSTRAPHWSGGGVALGPKPRSYKQKTPKKMVQLALRSALSDRASEGKVAVVDAWSFTGPKTKDAVAALKALELDGKVLVVVGPDDDAAYRSFRNLPDVQLVLRAELNAYDVLCNDWIVFTESTLPGTSTPASEETAKPAATTGKSIDEAAATQDTDTEPADTEAAEPVDAAAETEPAAEAEAESDEAETTEEAGE
jgi:large subunit ribosomal protein L4